MATIGAARVQLETWDDVTFAATQGLIDEREHCELKKGLPPNAQNTEVRRDLASFGPWGGVLIYGVQDAGGGRAGDVVGVTDSDGAKARLVALADALEPSLQCVVTIVRDPESEDRAVILVEVPPSPVAPHRADERYWGRGSEGKRVLTDAEVTALIVQRRHRSDSFTDHLEALAGDDFDPRGNDRINGGLYLSAQPLQPPLGEAPWLSGRSQVRLQEILVRAVTRSGLWGGADLTSLNYPEAHPLGLAAASRDPRGLAELAGDGESEALRLLLRDDGGIDLASGAGTMTRELHEGWPRKSVHLALVMLLTDQLTRLAGHIADLRSDAGTWQLGVRLTGLRGAHALGGGGPFPLDTHVSTTQARGAEMLDGAPEVVGRLLRSLLRGFGHNFRLPYENVDTQFRR